MNHGFSRTKLALVSVTCATLWGCGAEGDHLDNATGDDPNAVDSIAAPLNTAPVYMFTNPPNPSDCTRFTNLLDGATKEAAENLRNPLTDQCLQNAVLTYTDSYPEAILARMREPRALHMWCQETLETDITDGVPYDAIAVGNLSPSGLGLKWRNSTLSSLSGRTFQQNAAVLLHEVAHNWGHAHPNGTQSSPSLNFTQALDYQHSVPTQVETCAFNARDGRVMPVNLRRDRIPNETTLAPVGRLAQGGAFERRCAFGVGFHFMSGSFVDAIDLACLSINPGGPPQQPNFAGGGGGGPRSSLCNGNELLVGIGGFVDDNQINQAFAACLPISSVQARNQTDFRFAGTAAGLPGGHFFTRRCPNGTFVSAIRGMAAPFVHRLELECMDIGSVRTVSESPIPQGWVGGNGGSLRIEKCIGRGAMVGLTHQSGAIVDRLGGMCDTISTTCSGGTCIDRLTTFSPRVLPGHGGMGGGVAESRCPGNSALVGILGSTGPGMGLPNLFQWGMAICADVAGWSNVSAPQPPVTFGPQFGTGGAFNFARVCPRGSFINGWRIRAGAFVDGLEPICRDFN